MVPVSIPRVDKPDRFVSERLGKGLFKIAHITVRVGYHDSWNVPEALAAGPQARASWTATSTSSTPPTSSRG